MRRVDPLGAIAVLLLLAVGALAIAASGADRSTGALGRTASIYDESPGGASVLRRYLEDVGFRVVSVEGDRFAPVAADPGVLFLLGARDQLTADDRRQLHDFVRFGGTLVVATDFAFNERTLLNELGVAVSRQALTTGVVGVRSIAFAEPPVRSVAVDLGIGLVAQHDAEPLVGDDRGALVVMATEGRGRVFAVGSLAPFLNGAIGDEDNGRFALALAQNPRAVVGFDEYHHGVRPAPDFTALLSNTWLGRALLASGALLFVYLVLTGRRLGPPLPLDSRPPRSSLEFIRGFAGLARRSGHGEIARRRLRTDLHRGLARMTGMDPETAFDRLASALAEQSPSRAADARALDAALAGRLREDALVRAANDVQRIIGPEAST